MGLSGLVFYYIGVSLGWLYTFMGVLLGSAVVPIALCVTWKQANKLGCMAGAVIGLVCGIISWLVATSTLNKGKINVTTSGGDYEMLTGNLVAIAIGGLIATISSYVWPDDFDFKITRMINVGPLETYEGDIPGTEEMDEKKGSNNDDSGSGTKEVDNNTTSGVVGLPENMDPIALKKAFSFAVYSSVVLTLIGVIIVPLPLFFSSVVYGVRGLTAWVVIGIIWVFCAIITVVIMPLYESRAALVQIFRGIVKDVYSPGSGKFVHHPREEPAHAGA